jgi:putative redox protein
MTHHAEASATETGQGAYQLRIDSAGHSFLADEPEALGGLGSGPAPYDLLCAALAACTTITLRMVAARKGFALDLLHTEVTHQRQQGQQPADLFTRTITITGDLSAQERDQLLEIADRCPVHKTLAAGARIATGLSPI